jgi:hypothetical protein
LCLTALLLTLISTNTTGMPQLKIYKVLLCYFWLRFCLIWHFYYSVSLFYFRVTYCQQLLRIFITHFQMISVGQKRSSFADARKRVGTIHLWPASSCSHPCTSFLGAFENLRKATLSFVMSVCPSAWNNSAPTGRIFVKFSIWVFLENSSGKFKFRQNQSRIIGTLGEELYTSRWLILRLSNFSDRSCRENENTHFVCRLWENMAKDGIARQATDDSIMRRMRFARRIAKAGIRTLVILNNYCFPTATMVTQTRHSVAL